MHAWPLLRACNVLSTILFVYFAYGVLVHGYRDLIVGAAVR